MTSRVPRCRMFFLTVATVLACNLLLPPPSTAFSFSAIKTPSACAKDSLLSPVTLYAKKKKKKGNSSSKGFGNSQNKKQEPMVESEPATTMSADVVARLNALYTLEVDDTENDKEQPENDSHELSEFELSIKNEESGTRNVEDKSSADTDNKHSDHSSGGGSSLIAQRYRKEFEYQQSMSENRRNKNQLVQLSSSPLIFTIDEFIDPEACRRVENDATGCFDLMYPELLSDKLFNGQESEMDGLLFNLESSKEHTTDDPYPNGLHMDTNNRCLNRHVTCILYLNDIPEECGGATVFPLARTMADDPVLQASKRILHSKISHTRQQLPTEELKSDALLLESRLPVQDDYIENPETSTAIRIQPKAGKLLVFFSRDEDGQDDPRAWHAGERIRPNQQNQMTEKRILTLFKEVFYEDDNNDKKTKDITGTSLEEHLAPMVKEQRTWLKAKAKLQRALLEQQSS